MNDKEIIECFERENITLAPIKKRVAAYIIDEVLISVLFLLIYSGTFNNQDNVEETINAINSMIMYIFILKIIYHTFFVCMYGATIGKIFLKIKVISTLDLGNPSLLFSLSRSIIRILSESLFYIGFLWVYTNAKREAWHDKIAKTLVVNVF